MLPIEVNKSRKPARAWKDSQATVVRLRLWQSSDQGYFHAACPFHTSTWTLPASRSNMKAERAPTDYCSCMCIHTDSVPMSLDMVYNKIPVSTPYVHVAHTCLMYNPSDH